jgi:Na+/melibiose symporter-like transporter
VTIATLIGIRVLMCVFPSIAIGLALLFFRKFPISREKYAEIKGKLEELHSEKLQKAV